MLVIGFLLNVVLDFGKRGIKGGIQAVIAIVTFTVLILNLNIVFLVLLALAITALYIRPDNNVGKAGKPNLKLQRSNNFALSKNESAIHV